MPHKTNQKPLPADAELDDVLAFYFPEERPAGSRKTLIQPYEVHCPKCGELIGTYIQVGDKVCLQIGTVIIQMMHGHCCKCNSEYHWVESKKSLEALVRRKSRPLIIRRNIDQVFNVSVETVRIDRAE